ncbi:MAG: ABC transporter permease, partial [Rhizobiales bacterium]|nr:ABC transporter permease [Hyphomicrobiales bacterium]
MTIQWIWGLLRTQPGRSIGFAAGLAMSVALLAMLGLFMHHSAASMTARSIATVPIDWQVELVPGADATGIESAIRNAASARVVEPVGYAKVNGFEFGTGTVQTTGEGKAVGLGPDYLTA